MQVLCQPQGICSWNYELRAERWQGTAEFNWLREEGELVIDGKRYDICKHGMMSGRWTLETPGMVLCEAIKENAFSRTVQIKTGETQSTLHAASMFGRSMVLEHPAGHLTLSPVHAFTRRAIIEGDEAGAELVGFTFWLTALTWRRAAQNSNSAT